ncbi:MAG: hypothetical protein ACKOTZ_08390 [Chloroflexota bacterium]
MPWATERTGLSGLLPMPVWVVAAGVAAAPALHLALEVPMDRVRHSARFRAWAAGGSGQPGAGAVTRPGGRRAPRWGMVVAAAWIGLPFVYVGAVALGQSRQVMTTSEHAIADITDARWDRGIGRNAAEVALVPTAEAEAAFPWYGGAEFADAARWVRGTWREPTYLVVLLEGERVAPDPNGAPGVLRAVRRTWAP